MTRVPCSDRAFEPQPTVEGLDAVGQAEKARSRRDFGTADVVADLDEGEAVLVRDAHLRGRRPRGFRDVGRRLRHNVVGGCLDRGWWSRESGWGLAREPGPSLHSARSGRSGNRDSSRFPGDVGRRTTAARRAALHRFAPRGTRAAEFHFRFYRPCRTRTSYNDSRTHEEPDKISQV
jgi:hypothetical protein